jgi:hypothetical protein
MNTKLLSLSLLVLISAFFFSACNDDDDNEQAVKLAGLWVQEKVTEDGTEINFPAEQKNIRLFFESNGVYRTYAKDMPANQEHFGAWTITDNTWLELTVDTWHVTSDPLSQKPENQWVKNHILTRFTILTLSDNVLEIRIKHFVGETKYAALFVENARPVVTSENMEEIQQDYKIIKTYIYTFKKAAI